jgi:hypothetical protein
MIKMKKIISILAIVFLGATLSVNAQCGKCPSKATCATPKDGKASIALAAPQSVENVKVYYFHATRRCATCEAVESVTKEALKENYGEKVAFQSINIEEDKDNPLVKKYEISGQTLIIINGDNSKNLTNFAFMNARTRPEKLKVKIKSTIDSML